ncbi:hypothetical protein [Pseudonocardia sp. GCM10023141]|uniref:hypothetical protein n=1 Tax=Pseudonocardia sp. GCM10023141 TaxID=3252653 RepID=UPI00360911B3
MTDQPTRCALPGCTSVIEQPQDGGPPRLYCTAAHRAAARKLRHVARADSAAPTSPAAKPAAPSGPAEATIPISLPGAAAAAVTTPVAPAASATPPPISAPRLPVPPLAPPRLGRTDPGRTDPGRTDPGRTDAAPTAPNTPAAPPVATPRRAPRVPSEERTVQLPAPAATVAGPAAAPARSPLADGPVVTIVSRRSVTRPAKKKQPRDRKLAAVLRRQRAVASIAVASLVIGGSSYVVTNASLSTPQDPTPQQAKAPVDAGDWANRAQIALVSITKQLNSVTQTESAWQNLPADVRGAQPPAAVQALQARKSLLEQQQAALRSQLAALQSLPQATTDLTAAQNELSAIERALATAPAGAPDSVQALNAQRELRVQQRDHSVEQLTNLRAGVDKALAAPLPDTTDQSAPVVRQVQALIDDHHTPDRPPAVLAQAPAPDTARSAPSGRDNAAAATPAPARSADTARSSAPAVADKPSGPVGGVVRAVGQTVDTVADVVSGPSASDRGSSHDEDAGDGGSRGRDPGNPDSGNAGSHDGSNPVETVTRPISRVADTVGGVLGGGERGGDERGGGERGGDSHEHKRTPVGKVNRKGNNGGVNNGGGIIGGVVGGIVGRGNQNGPGNAGVGNPQKPGNQKPGNQKPGNQKPGNQKPGSPTPGSQNDPSRNGSGNGNGNVGGNQGGNSHTGNDHSGDHRGKGDSKPLTKAQRAQAAEVVKQASDEIGKRLGGSDGNGAGQGAQGGDRNTGKQHDAGKQGDSGGQGGSGGQGSGGSGSVAKQSNTSKS